MSERQDRDWISDIKEAVARVEEYTTGLWYERFLDDKKTQDAVVRNIDCKAPDPLWKLWGTHESPFGETEKKGGSQTAESVLNAPAEID